MLIFSVSFLKILGFEKEKLNKMNKIYYEIIIINTVSGQKESGYWNVGLCI